MNRIVWLDTLRVLASFLVILSHFAYNSNNIPSVHNFISHYILFIGQIGNMLFFAVSGYLATNSIERSSSIFEFYRKKIIRITVPYTITYIILGILLVVIGIFDSRLIEQSPFKNVDADYLKIFFGMFPIASDINLVKILDIPTFYFIGEWFIGTVIYLYIISPLLYKCIRLNVFVTFIFSIIISVFTYNYTDTWAEAGYIAESTVLFPIWIPSFLLGMILYMYQDFILIHRRKLTQIFILLSAVLISYSGYFNIYAQSIWEKIILGSPINIWQYLFANVIIVYFLYIIAEALNENFNKFMFGINKFSNISYVAMLIQKVTIASFFSLYNFSVFDKIDVIVLFVSIILITVFISEFIKKFYKPIEERLIKRRVFLEYREKF